MMMCPSCKYLGKFGKITFIGGGDGYGNRAIGWMPPAPHVEGAGYPSNDSSRHCGAVEIHVCPKCGVLHSDMNGMVKV